MAIAGTGAHEEEIGGQSRRLLLRNREIERFEVQHNLGIFVVWEQIFGRGTAPQARHIRDLVALGLVGGGMSDRAADDLIAAMGPAENFRLLETARRILGIAMIPAVLEQDAKKPEGAGIQTETEAGSGMSAPASETSAE